MVLRKNAWLGHKYTANKQQSKPVRNLSAPWPVTAVSQTSNCLCSHSYFRYLFDVFLSARTQYAIETRLACGTIPAASVGICWGIGCWGICCRGICESMKTCPIKIGCFICCDWTPSRGWTYRSPWSQDLASRSPAVYYCKSASSISYNDLINRKCGWASSAITYTYSICSCFKM